MFKQWQTSFLTEKIFPGLRNGFFVEAGAAEGTASSTTYELEKEFGWNGICVEPNGIFFKQLSQNRRCHVFNCALHSEDTELEFLSAGYLGAARQQVEKFHKAIGSDVYQHPNYARDIDGEKRVITVPARSLRSIFAEINYTDRVDFFSLDVEGGEEFVLKGFPFDTHKIMVCVVETIWKFESGKMFAPYRATVRDILEENDMVLVGEREVDEIYINREIIRERFL